MIGDKIIENISRDRRVVITPEQFTSCRCSDCLVNEENEDCNNIKMKNLKDDELTKYLDKIETETLLAYGVYQIEEGGRDLFSKIEGDEDTIMGLPVKKIKEYLNNI